MSIANDRYYNLLIQLVVVLHNSVTWDLYVEDMHTLERNESSMLCWLCDMYVHVGQSADVLREKCSRRGIKCRMQEKIRLFGREICMNEDSCKKRCWSLGGNETCGRDSKRHGMKWWVPISVCWVSQKRWQIHQDVLWYEFLEKTCPLQWNWILEALNTMCSSVHMLWLSLLLAP